MRKGRCRRRWERLNIWRRNVVQVFIAISTGEKGSSSNSSWASSVGRGDDGLTGRSESVTVSSYLQRTSLLDINAGSIVGERVGKAGRSSDDGPLKEDLPDDVRHYARYARNLPKPAGYLNPIS